jgi:hypothetical protein
MEVRLAIEAGFLKFITLLYSKAANGMPGGVVAFTQDTFEVGGDVASRGGMVLCTLCTGGCGFFARLGSVAVL